MILQKKIVKYKPEKQLTGIIIKGDSRMAELGGDFDLVLAAECAGAFSSASGLGCTVYGAGGGVLFEAGSGCASCAVCAAAGVPKEHCARYHEYGMTEAERFGGKYIYFCHMGLTCFVSPIVGQSGSAAKITVGPFFMVDTEDYIECDLKQKLGLDAEKIKRVLEAARDLPYIPAEKVNPLSVLLFMAVGFMNNVSGVNRMLETRKSGELQGNISEYIRSLKTGEAPPEYPYGTEKELAASIAGFDRAAAQRLLNELMGHILFSSGGDFGRIKSRMYELLVVISRAAVDAGALGDYAFSLNHGFFAKAASAVNIDELCLLLSDVMNRYIDGIFEFADVKYADIIRKAVLFMRGGYTKKITLEDIAGRVYLSPTYFSKLFKQEMGCSPGAYLNRLRIEKAGQILLASELPLVEIANALGFEDQSYFTKVFKRLYGVSPNQYRKSGGKRLKRDDSML